MKITKRKPGETCWRKRSVPVLTRHGWHVVRMDAMAPGAVLPFDAVRGKIAAAMEKASWARAAREFMRTLVEKADISGADLRSA